MSFGVKNMVGYLLLMLMFLTQCGCKSTVKWPDDQFYILLEENLNCQSGFWSINVEMPISKIVIRACARPILYDADFEYAQEVNTAIGSGLIIKLKHSAVIELFKLSISCENQKLLLMKNGYPVGMTQEITGAITDDLLLIFLEDDSKTKSIVDTINSNVEFYAKQHSK